MTHDSHELGNDRHSWNAASVSGRVHVFYGYAKREAELDERCLYCDRHFEVMAYTYFGGPVCGVCWEEHWRKSEDGECDPAFHEITRKVSGEWLA